MVPIGSYILRCKVILPVGSDILLPQSYIAVAVIFALRQVLNEIVGDGAFDVP